MAASPETGLTERTLVVATSDHGTEFREHGFLEKKLNLYEEIIRVPLRETDPDVPLNLQALIERCYHNGRYDDINYRADPNPPLSSEDAAWASDLLSGKGLR